MEFDFWSISSFRMESTFASDHLRVELTLTTDAGSSVFPAHLSGLLLEKNVVICFTVQHAQMAELYDFIREVQTTELNRHLEQLRYGPRFHARRRGAACHQRPDTTRPGPRNPG